MADSQSKIDFLQEILQAIPSILLIAEADGRIQFLNRRTAEFFGADPDDSYLKQCGDVFRCIHTDDVPEGCGFSAFCRAECVVRKAITDVAQAGKAVVRKRFSMMHGDPDSPTQIYGMVSATPLSLGGETRVLMTIEDITELVRLQGLLPICSHCKKIRNSDNDWESVEQYVTSRTDVTFTHGLCPDCERELIESARRMTARDDDD